MIDVKTLRKISRPQIKAKASGKNRVNNLFYGLEKYINIEKRIAPINHNICYSSIYGRSMYMKIGKDCPYYQLVRVNDKFNMKTLVKELNIIFSYYVEIEIINSGNVDVKILRINFKRNFEDYNIAYCTIMLLGVLIRLFDEEGSRIIHTSLEKKISDLTTLIMKSVNDAQMYGHSINETLRVYGKAYKPRSYNEEFLKTLVNKFIDTINKVAGEERDFEFKYPEKFNKKLFNTRLIGQSSAFSYYEKLLEEADK